MEFIVQFIFGCLIFVTIVMIIIEGLGYNSHVNKMNDNNGSVPQQQITTEEASESISSPRNIEWINQVFANAAPLGSSYMLGVDPSEIIYFTKDMNNVTEAYTY